MVERTLATGLRIRDGFSFTSVHRMYLAEPTRRCAILQCYGEVFTDESGRPLRMLGTAHDISGSSARPRTSWPTWRPHDPLTGLPNRGGRSPPG